MMKMFAGRDAIRSSSSLTKSPRMHCGEMGGGVWWPECVFRAEAVEAPSCNLLTSKKDATRRSQCVFVCDVICKRSSSTASSVQQPAQQDGCHPTHPQNPPPTPFPTFQLPYFWEMFCCQGDSHMGCCVAVCVAGANAVLLSRPQAPGQSSAGRAGRGVWC